MRVKLFQVLRGSTIFVKNKTGIDSLTFKRLDGMYSFSISKNGEMVCLLANSDLIMNDDLTYTLITEDMKCLL